MASLLWNYPKSHRFWVTVGHYRTFHSWLENWAWSTLYAPHVKWQNAECSEGKIKGRPAKNLLEQLELRYHREPHHHTTFVCGHTFSIAHAMSWSIRHNEILLTEVCHDGSMPQRATPSTLSHRTANPSISQIRKGNQQTSLATELEKIHHHTTIYWRRCNNFYCLSEKKIYKRYAGRSTFTPSHH